MTKMTFTTFFPTNEREAKTLTTGASMNYPRPSETTMTTARVVPRPPTHSSLLPSWR